MPTELHKHTKARTRRLKAFRQRLKARRRRRMAKLAKRKKGRRKRPRRQKEQGLLDVIASVFRRKRPKPGFDNYNFQHLMDDEKEN